MAKIRALTHFFFDRVVLQHPLMILLCVMAACGVLAFGAKNFRLDASAETLVLQNDEDLRSWRLIDSRYGQNDFLILTFTPADELFCQKTLSSLKRLRNELRSLERVESVISILDVPLMESPPVSIKELTTELPTLEAPNVDRGLASAELRNSPIYRNLLVSPDAKTTGLIINFAGDKTFRDLLGRRDELQAGKAAGSITRREKKELKRVVVRFRQYRDKMRRQRHQDIAAIHRIMDGYRRDGELFLGGVGMIADDMIGFIKNDLKVFGLAVFFLLVLTLGIIFKRLRWITLPVLCCVVSVVCMTGILGFFGWEVTVISSNFISLQLIITLAIVIHLTVRYRELSVKSTQIPNRQLILETILLKIKPCVYAALTTIAGFGSLVLCDIKPVINFGWMMIAGLVVSLVVTFLLFPSVLVLMPRERPHPLRKWRFSLVSITAGFTERGGLFIVTISVLILVLSIIGISKLEVENSFIDYFKKNTEIYRGMKLIDERLGGTTPLDVVVDFDRSDETPPPAEAPEESYDVFDEFDELDRAAEQPKYWFTAEKTNRINAIHRYLDSLPQTGKVLSLASILSVAEKLNNGRPLDSFQLALLYSETPEKFRTMLISPYVSTEYSQARFWVRIRDSEKGLRRNDLIKKIEAEMTGKLGLKAANVHLAGLLVMYNNMLQSLFGSQIITIGLTILLLMGMFLVLFRSVKIALIAIFPNVLSITAVLGVMGWLNIPLDMMTITIASISVGIAVDNTIHYIHRFKSEFIEDRNYLKTMHRCHRSIGHAMYYTSITVIIGFSILALSNFIPSIYFGLLTGLAMLIALIAALTLLPQLLILFRPFGREA